MALTTEQTAQVALLRKMVDEPTTAVYSDDELYLVLSQAEMDLDAASAEIWGMKAARFAGLVDTSESGSSRSMSQLYRNALQMKTMHEARIKEEVAVTTAEVRPRVRRAVRL